MPNKVLLWPKLFAGTIYPTGIYVEDCTYGDGPAGNGGGDCWNLRPHNTGEGRYPNEAAYETYGAGGGRHYGGTDV